MTTVKQLLDLPFLPRDEEGPVFAEPWQAQAFAVVVRLIETGRISPAEWTNRLSAVLNRAISMDANDSASRYYEHWLQALEEILLNNNLTCELDLLAEQQHIKENDHHNKAQQEKATH